MRGRRPRCAICHAVATLYRWASHRGGRLLEGAARTNRAQSEPRPPTFVRGAGCRRAPTPILPSACMHACVRACVRAAGGASARRMGMAGHWHGICKGALDLRPGIAPAAEVCCGNADGPVRRPGPDTAIPMLEVGPVQDWQTGPLAAQPGISSHRQAVAAAESGKTRGDKTAISHGYCRPAAHVGGRRQLTARPHALDQHDS